MGTVSATYVPFSFLSAKSICSVKLKEMPAEDSKTAPSLMIGMSTRLGIFWFVMLSSS